ncbi:hypothetical protein [Acanthopleuribacter pedis]|uniref:Uncharacterized protein n=1 Tax=Acanthopleuribacter pedis TaxID=442870 RepID=A0A8J7U6I2_9BACT|nr:hypothetical protein [Acanthopleuribacter pedis]MBO1322802.1 hypothetical protein [Acanthopleuribacter pedis]
MDALFETLSRRPRPEDVAVLLLKTHRGHLSAASQKALKRAADYATRYPYSSMWNEFASPVDFSNKTSVLADLFPGVTLSSEDRAHPPAIGAGLERAGAMIGKTRTGNSFLYDRLNKEHREALGMDISKKQYNKRFRFLRRMEAKLERLLKNQELADLITKGFSGLATDPSHRVFSEDPATAAFIAYYTARCNMRSTFTFGTQVRPYDTIAESLMETCRNQTTTNWFAIAHVYPDLAVLANLTAHQTGILLGRWYGILERCAVQLKQVWEASTFHRDTMVVKRGDDSTTWNLLAGAWNRARRNWIALNDAMGTEDILDTLCLGKVLRLMAADVAWGHQIYGDALEDDTPVWAELPFPWQVFAGEAECTRIMVEKVCRRHGVDPIVKGWIAPPAKHPPVPFTFTPELVHGVAVGHPALAKILKQLGMFSGKKLKFKR